MFSYASEICIEKAQFDQGPCDDAYILNYGTIAGLLGVVGGSCGKITASRAHALPAF
jgi:hypothetical protein